MFDVLILVSPFIDVTRIEHVPLGIALIPHGHVFLPTFSTEVQGVQPPAAVSRNELAAL
ncbi:hypothetical protein [Pusillimonas sp.]|uniref:hypothetical protein n=1 Tax=Pusillimonas sp. TaxID=3040095 RepID=UPI0029AFCFE7|nr:hypothetical protein [Pusillimonas sp.]MDX3896427.1 hypothetical protein [Pusillimonas sp.]